MREGAVGTNSRVTRVRVMFRDIPTPKRYEYRALPRKRGYRNSSKAGPLRAGLGGLCDARVVRAVVYDYSVVQANSITGTGLSVSLTYVKRKRLCPEGRVFSSSFPFILG